jgi:ribosomal protein S18 acetylase RimI-like enzyme
LRIRKAKKTELAEVLALQKQAYQSEAELYSDFSIPPLTQTLESLESEFEQGLVLVAVEDGGILGSVRATLKNGICHIGKLIVHPSSQGRGIGTQLMNNIENNFADAAAFEVFTGMRSEGNLRLYRRLGYRDSDKKFINENLSLIFLRKARE